MSKAFLKRLLAIVATQQIVGALGVDGRLAQVADGTFEFLEREEAITEAVGHGVVVVDGILGWLVVVSETVANEVLHITLVELVAVEVILDAVGDVVDSGLRVVEVAAAHSSPPLSPSSRAMARKRMSLSGETLVGLPSHETLPSATWK